MRRGLNHLLPLLALSFFLSGGATSQAEERTPEDVLTQAQQLIQKGDLTGARTRLMQAMKETPGEAGIYNLLGVVEAQEGNYRPAEAQFIKALQLAPGYEGASLNLGRLYQEHVGDDPEALDKAIGTYKHLIQSVPENLEAKYQLAVLYNWKGDFQASLHYLELIPRPQRSRAQALALMGSNYAALDEHEKARETLARLAISPDLSESEVASILPTLTAHEAEDLAVQLLEALDRRGLASAASLYQLGILYRQQGMLPQARATLLKTAQFEPDSVPILIELARVAYQQEDYHSALSFLVHARDLEPGNAAIHFFFGIASAHLNLVEEAYRSLQQAVSLAPDNAYYNYAMGVAAEVKERYREAVKYIERYCELRPADVRGRLALGIAYFYSYENELARKEFNFAVEHPETAAGAHYFLARLANQHGDLDAALREIEASLKTAPNFAAAYAELGSLHMKRKEYEQAEESLKKALELEPEDYQANLYLTMLYARTRDPRAEAQKKAFDELKKKRSEKAKEFYRVIEVRPPG